MCFSSNKIISKHVLVKHLKSSTCIRLVNHFRCPGLVLFGVSPPPTPHSLCSYCLSAVYFCFRLDSSIFHISGSFLHFFRNTCQKYLKLSFSSSLDVTLVVQKTMILHSCVIWHFFLLVTKENYKNKSSAQDLIILKFPMILYV